MPVTFAKRQPASEYHGRGSDQGRVPAQWTILFNGVQVGVIFGTDSHYMSGSDYEVYELPEGKDFPRPLRLFAANRPLARAKEWAAARNWTKSDIGCYFDGARGWGEIHDLVQDFARLEGWSAKTDNINEHAEDFPLWQDEATDEAEEYLNTLTDDTVYFGSSEAGDWGLWLIEDDA